MFEALDDLGLVEEPDADPLLPARFGPYRVLRLLGSGGMGTVYLAEHETLGRQAALKVVHAAHLHAARARDRFRREALAIAQLDHPGICPIYEVGDEQGTPWLAMRYVPGTTLAECIARSMLADNSVVALPPASSSDGPAPTLPVSSAPAPGVHRGIDAVLRLVEKLAHALHAAHEAGVIHRDVKPGNVVVTPQGEPVLLDFGLARVVDDQEIAGGDATLTVAAVGTPAYMAPEQIRQDGRAHDARCDVWALGVVLHECLTLRAPFAAVDREHLFQAVLRSEPSNPRRHNRRLPRDLVVVLQTALAKEPNRRYATAQALAEDLRRVRARQPIRARRASPWLRLRRFTARHPALALAAVVVLLALATTVVALLESNARLRQARALALLREAEAALETDQMAALLLALRTVELEPTPDAIAVLQQACAAARERATFRHAGSVEWVEFAADGRALLTTSFDGAVRLLDLQGRDLVSPMRHPGAVWRATVAANGDVLTACDDALARIWRGGRVIRELGGHERPLSDARWSPDGRKALTACAGGVARLWDAESGRLLRSYGGSGSPLIAAMFLPGDGERVVTGAVDGQAHLYSGGVVTSLPLFGPGTDALQHLAIARDGSSLLAAVYDGSVRMFRLDGTLRAVLAGHGGVVNVIAPATSGLVLTAGSDQSARIFEVEAALSAGTAAGKELLAFRRSGGAVQAAALSPDETLVATAHEDGVMALWDMDVAPLPVLRGHGGVVRMAAWSPRGDHLVTAAGNGRVRLWTAAGEPVCDLAAPSGKALLCAAFSDDGARVLTGYWDGTVRAFDLHGRKSWPGGLHTGGRVNAIDCRADGVFLTAHGDERLVRLWRADGTPLGEPLHAGGGDVTNATFVPGAILVASQNGTAILYPDAGGEPLLLRHEARVMSATASPDGRWLLTASSDGTAKVWARGDGSLVLTLRHEAGVTSAAFSDDGERIVTSCRDNAARVWDRRGNLQALLRGHRGVVWRATFAPGGRRVVTASFDHTARMWLVDPADVLALGQRRAYRDFTPAEIARYAGLLGAPTSAR